MKPPPRGSFLAIVGSALLVVAVAMRRSPSPLAEWSVTLGGVFLALALLIGVAAHRGRSAAQRVTAIVAALVLLAACMPLWHRHYSYGGERHGHPAFTAPHDH